MKSRIILSLCLLIVNYAFGLNGTHFTINRITAPYFVVDGNNPSTLTKAYVGFEVINNSNSATTYPRLVLQIDSITSSVNGQSYVVLSPSSSQIVVGTLAPGQSKVCYFFVSYPASTTPIATFYLKLSDTTASNKTQIFSIYNRSSISANAGGAATQNFTNQDLLGGIIMDDVTYKVGNVQNNNEVDFQVSVSSLFDPAKMTLMSTQVLSSSVPGVVAGTTDSLYFRTGNGSSGDTVKIRWVFRITGYNFTSYILPCAGATSGNSNYKYTLNTSLGANGTPVTVSSTANPLTIEKRSDKSIYYKCETATFTVVVKNPGIYGVSIDSIRDQLPTGFSFVSFSPLSNVNNSNSSSYPASGKTGVLTFVGGVNSGGNLSYYIPAGDSIKLIYSATAYCTVASNLTSTVGGYIGDIQFATASNAVSVTWALPLNWVSFTAQKQGTAVLLNWRTAQEQNTRSFFVEHSTDGYNWNTIGELAANNNVNLKAEYSFWHNTPAAGSNYYRIRQTDLDNKFTYSEIRRVDMPATNKVITLLSGNVVQQGYLRVQLKTSASLAIYSNTGQLVWQQLLPAGIHALPLSSMAKGSYLLKAGSVTEKIVIQ
jgi:uncharacterized repeat protein (TIGR01451 family)